MISCGHWARGVVHPGQVASPSQHQKKDKRDKTLTPRNNLELSINRVLPSAVPGLLRHQFNLQFQLQSEFSGPSRQHRSRQSRVRWPTKNELVFARHLKTELPLQLPLSSFSDTYYSLTGVPPWSNSPPDTRLGGPSGHSVRHSGLIFLPLYLQDKNLQEEGHFAAANQRKQCLWLER